MGFTKFSLLLLVCVAVAMDKVAKADQEKIKTAMEACVTATPAADPVKPTCPEFKKWLMCTIEKVMEDGSDKETLKPLDVISMAEDIRTVLAEKVAAVSGLTCVQAVDAAFVRETIQAKCDKAGKDDAVTSDDKKCAKILKNVVCVAAHTPENAKDTVANIKAAVKKQEDRQTLVAGRCSFAPETADFMKKVVAAKCDNANKDEKTTNDEEKCAKVKKLVLCQMMHSEGMKMTADEVKTKVTEMAKTESLTDCDANIDFLKEAVMKKCEGKNMEGTAAKKCAGQLMCAVAERPPQDKDLKMAAEGLLEKIKAKKDCAGEDLKIDTSFLQKAVTAGKLGECTKKDDPATGKDDAEKCAKLKAAMKCSIGGIGQGYDLLKMKDGLQEKMTEEATKLGLKPEDCAKDFVNVDAITGAVEKKCKKSEEVAANDETDKQKCDKIKKRMGCVGASMVKKENLSLTSIKDNLMSLVEKVKTAATKESLTDCKTNALGLVSSIKSAYTGAATMAQVSFVSLVMALTAAVMLR